MYPSKEMRLLELLSGGEFISWRRPAPNLLLARYRGFGVFGDEANRRVDTVSFPVVWFISHRQSWSRQHKTDGDYWQFEPCLKSATYEYQKIRTQLAEMLPPEPQFPVNHRGQPFIGTALQLDIVRLGMHASPIGYDEYCGLATVHYLEDDRPDLAARCSKLELLQLLDEGHQVTERPIPFRIVRIQYPHRNDESVFCYGLPYRLAHETEFNLWGKIVYNHTYLCPQFNCIHYQNRGKLTYHLFQRCFRQRDLEELAGTAVLD